MRYTFAFAFASCLALVGCDDTHSGQSADPGGPVQLVRIMVQDSQPRGLRGVAMDLLDTPGSLYSTAAACNDTSSPCAATYLIQSITPDFSCKAGVCNDPLAAGPAAPLTPPGSNAPGELGGTQIRLVFSKLLPSTIDAASVAELDDAAGNKVDAVVSWDPSGSPRFSSDIAYIPFGPAIVIKPKAPLDAGVQYTVKLNGALVSDRAGNPMADQSGTIIRDTYAKSFATEKLTLLPATTLTDITASSVAIAPDDILQLGFNARFDASTSCTATSGGASVAVKVYAEAGADAASCASATNATLMNIVAVDGAGQPTDWAAGSYDLSCTVAAHGGGGATTVSGTFTVAGAPTAGDPQARAQHVLCAQ